MSYHKGFIQGAGAIAAATRPRAFSALGMTPSTACSYYQNGVWYVRRENGSVDKVSPREAALYPTCVGLTGSPDLRSQLPAYRVARNLSTQLAPAVQMTAGPFSSGVVGVTSPGVAPLPPKPTAPPGYVPDPTASRPPAPVSISVSTPSSPSPIATPSPSTPTVVTFPVPSPSSSTSSGGAGGRGGSVTVTLPTAPSSPASWPTINVPQVTTTKKVPWLAIGLVALAAAVLLKK